MTKMLVDVSHLEKGIHTFKVGPIDLAIEPGTITALIGNNGSGKSTFLKMIMNLVKPDRGDIKVMGKWVNGDDENWKEHIAYLPQKQIGFDPYDGQTLKNLISSLYPNWDEEMFERLINNFEVPLRKKYAHLSPGVQQKLNLALTIPRNAQLMILDEPTNFMDIPSKKLLLDVLVDWMENGERSLLFASHQAEDIQKLADYLIILKDGKQIGTYEKEELLESYRTYWLDKDLESGVTIPGVIKTNNQKIISTDPASTEQSLTDLNISWHDSKAMNLEEIVSLIMK